MSDVIDRPILEQEASAKSRLADHRLRRASEPACAQRPQSVPVKTLAGAFEDLRRSSAHALYRHHALSAVFAADRAPRCLAADRRAARIRSRFHAQAAPRSARYRVRHPAGARSLYLLAAEPRIRRRDPARHQRMAARALDQPRAAAESLDPGRAGRYRSWRSPRSSAAPRSDNMSRSMCRRAPTSRSAAAATGRSTHVPQELGLPLGIHVGGYGGHAPTGGGWPSFYAEEHQTNAHTDGGEAHESRARRRPGAISAPQDRVHRRRLRLDSVGDVADGPAFRDDSATRCRISSGVRRNM